MDTEWWYFILGLIDSMDPLFVEVMRANGIVEEIDPVITRGSKDLPRFKISKENARKYNIKAGTMWSPLYDDVKEGTFSKSLDNTPKK